MDANRSGLGAKLADVDPGLAMKTKRRSVTSFDVARLAGVSQSAVSRAFTPGAVVADKTRLLVLEAARKLGYRPNAIARSLITNQSRIIGVVVSYLENQFYPIMLEQMSKALRAHGYHLLLFCIDRNDADDLLAEIMQYQVDGIVMASTHFSSALARNCQEAGIPVVLFNRTVSNNDCSAVVSNNIEGGRAAARLLCDTGHERIAFIAGQNDTSTSRDREAGFVSELGRAGSHCFARATGNYSSEGAVQSTLELFTRSPRPDAVFVANDHMALHTIDTLRQQLGLRVPEDVSVIGFDDVPQACWGAYQLTTVRQLALAMIDATVDLLLRQIGDRHAPAKEVVLPVEMVVRRTVRGVAPAA